MSRRRSRTLSRNPFPASVVPRKDVIFWADREEVRKRLLRFIQKKSEGTVETLLLLGNYGQGKTHAMLFISLYCKKRQIPHAYISNPGESFISFSRKAIESIGFERIVVTCSRVLQDNRDEILERMKEDDTLKLLNIQSLSAERMIRYAFPNIDGDLAIVLGHVYNNRLLDLSRAWILGRDLTRTEMGRLNVSRDISSDEYAAKILADVLRIILAANERFVILLDEFEDVANLSPSSALAYGKALRRFIDENISNLKIIISFVRDAYALFQENAGTFRGKSYAALVDRINFPRIELVGLTEVEMEKFMADFISRRYIGDLRDIIAEDAILAILKEAQDRYAGSPRGIITICHLVFRESLKEKDWPITKETLDEILLSLRFQSEKRI